MGAGSPHKLYIMTIRQFLALHGATEKRQADFAAQKSVATEDCVQFLAAHGTVVKLGQDVLTIVALKEGAQSSTGRIYKLKQWNAVPL